jgi:hypothetical protein
MRAPTMARQATEITIVAAEVKPAHVARPLGAARSSVYRVLGEADRGSMSGRWQADHPWMRARRLSGVFAIVALASCGPSPDGPLMPQANDPPSAKDAFSRQVGADVAAIFNGMARADGVRAVVVRGPQ